ncbi:hypothetical protein [Rhodococcus gannanensis]|uniref:Uncharacterized protein n=1 Tax=Rhodococcus gannanensis TaxID=1960308 RepID=A0ABW4P2H5_9NOCA
MGVIGEMFPGKKLENDDSQDGGGQMHRPRVELDLDAGVIRVTPPTRTSDQLDTDGASSDQ